MAVFTIILLSLSAFFLGYTLGNSISLNSPAKQRYLRTELSENEKREFENFLSYDGSEQS